MIKKESEDTIKPKKIELARFRAISVSVVISVISRFALSTFHPVHHNTMMNLSSPRWRAMIAGNLDAKLSLIVPLLTLVHTGDDVDDDENVSDKSRFVVLREGIVGILSSLLLN